MKYSSNKLKAILTMLGHTNIKRTVKRNNQQYTYREFVSSTASIVVHTDKDDVVVLKIECTPITSTLNALPGLVPVDLADFTAELERINSLSLLSYLTHNIAIYNIPVVANTLEPSVNYLIVNANTSPFVLNIHYDTVIQFSEFTITEQNYSVALVDYDGTVEGSFVIPKGYYVHHFYPEYMQLIAVSTDFASGACTYNPEADTYTFDQDISSTFGIDLIDRTNHEPTFLKTARKFDILATSN